MPDDEESELPLAAIKKQIPRCACLPATADRPQARSEWQPRTLHFSAQGRRREKRSAFERSSGRVKARKGRLGTE